MRYLFWVVLFSVNTCATLLFAFLTFLFVLKELEFDFGVMTCLAFIILSTRFGAWQLEKYFNVDM